MSETDVIRLRLLASGTNKSVYSLFQRYFTIAKSVLNWIRSGPMAVKCRLSWLAFEFRRKQSLGRRLVTSRVAALETKTREPKLHLKRFNLGSESSNG